MTSAPSAPDLHEIARETARRRTFAIISHPDAGKTTLTEKLLLYSGLLRTAGMVKGRKGTFATSDWMKLEQERGISITSSAMQFEYRGLVLNMLDTPGHQDFSEDTYRTLTAADSAIMIIDAAKGVETQTRKLFEVCRLRRTPVMTFINKLDLHGREPLDLMTEVEEVLGIGAAAMNWPLGRGPQFSGIIDRHTRQVQVYQRTRAGGAQRADTEQLALDDPRLPGLVGADELAAATEGMELAEVAGNAFSREAFLKGDVTPTFFGSALTNFGVEPLLDAFVQLAPPPGPRMVFLPDGQEVPFDPVREPFSAFVFKIQANMDPKHRDQVSFARVCSGRFERGLLAYVDRLEKPIRLVRPHTLVARERELVDLAYPGDVVAIVNRGTLHIGDTLSLLPGLRHQPLPRFQPEHFARIGPKDPSGRKRLDKGLAQLVAEGAVQALRPVSGSEGSVIVAAVGLLQFEVLRFRLQDEYGVEVQLTPLPYSCSAWLEGDVATFEPNVSALMVRDARERVLVLFNDEWGKRYAAKQNPSHRLLDVA